MKDHIQFPDFTYRYRIIDMRQINCREPIFSDNIEDKLLAALCNIEEPQFYAEHMKTILEQGLIKSQEEKMPIRVTIDLDEIVNDKDCNKDYSKDYNRGYSRG